MAAAARALPAFTWDPRLPLVTGWCLRWYRETCATGGKAGRARAMASQPAALFVWGKCKNTGVLGTGATVDEPRPTAVEGVADMATSLKLASGLHHMAMQTDKATLLTWGKGSGGRLGLGDELEGFVPDAVRLPDDVDAVTDVSLGGLHSAAIVRRKAAPNALLTWGHGGFGQLGHGDTQSRFVPTIVEGLQSPPTHISAGGAHTVVALEDGSLVAFGRDEGEGRLGSSHVSLSSVDDEYTVGSPSPVEVHAFLPSDAAVASISCGGFHSLCVDSAGGLWSWGASANGECGRGRGIGGPVPARVAIDAEVVAAVAGGFHSVALTSDGALYTWGWGEQGQLGHGDALDGLRGVWTPRRVDDLAGERAVHVACGPQTTYVITESGRLLACGWYVFRVECAVRPTASASEHLTNNIRSLPSRNEHFQLGDPSRERCDTFDDVPLPTSSRCLSIVAGTSHAAALVALA